MSSVSADINSLKAKAAQFRREILEILNAAGSGHPGGSLSLVEILTTLYFHTMNHRADDPQNRSAGREREPINPAFFFFNDNGHGR